MAVEAIRPRAAHKGPRGTARCGSLPPMDLAARARDVRMLVLDVDGVLTDGSLFYGPSGEALKRFHTRAGHGLGLLRKAATDAAILSARSTPIVEARARDLGIATVLQGEAEKGVGLDRLLQRTGMSEGAIGYIGDDVNDLPVLARAR